MKKVNSISLLFLTLLLAATFLAPPAGADARPEKVRVVMEDNYPPFVFRDNAGNPQGSQIDLWRLWEKKTGIRTEITLMDWAEAQRRLQTGEFDVIDKIARTEQRSKIYHFSEPFGSIEVPVFFLKDISGITDAASLKGFAVGVQKGDSAIEYLKKSGVDNLLLFSDYEEIVRAAKEHKVNVMVMDKAPALYFLHKHDILADFKQSAPLNTVSLYRAVKKGNVELLDTVEEGFRLITADELKKIETKWYGSSLGNKVPTTPIFAGIGSLCLMVLLLFVWNRTLKRSVEKQTAELKSTEEILRKNEEKFRAVFEQGYYLAGLMDLNGTLTDVNNTALQFSGAEKDAVIGKPFWETPWWAHSPELQEKVRQAVISAANGTLVVLEATHPAPDGTLRYIDFSLRPVKDQSGAVIYLVPEGRDITDRNNAESERLNLERQLLRTQKLESLGVLSGGIAHDFNNLLQVLLGNLELSLKKLQQENPARKNIDQAIKAGRHAAKLTNMMLAYSGKGVFVIKPLNLTKLVEENAIMLDAAIPKSITLVQHLDHAMPIIRADAGQLQQVVMNLITNAAEAIGDASGTITLTTGVSEFDQNTLNQSRLDEKTEAGRYVWLEVRDNGCGMEDDTQRKLFDPFFTTKFTGRGLGMSAVLGIIRAHKGAFLVESIPGSGTTITVLFPPADIDKQGESKPVFESDSGPKEANGPSVTVLVVDDEDMIRAVTIAMLKELGFATMAAAGGEEALTLFREAGDGIDVVLLDQVMPDMDGVTVFKELRRITPGIKVLLASGFSQQEVSDRFRGLGLNGFLPKPYTLKNLSEELSRILKGA